MNAIYARQSLDKKDSISIETQITLSELELGEDEPIEYYIDKGYSGKNTNRPDFRRLMVDIRLGLIKKVVVYKLDRLSRSLLDFAELIETFKKFNVEFVSVREKFDTSTPIGNAMLGIIMVFAQLERESIQIRVQDNYYARSSRGAYDSVAPFGFSKVRVKVNGKSVSTIDICEETADIMTEAFVSYAYTGTSLGYLSKALNKRKILSPRGTEWDSGKLSRMLANPVYVKADADVYSYYKAMGVKITNPIEDFIGINGCVTYGKWDHKRRKFSQLSEITLSLGLHKGFIDSETFLRCQDKLNNNEQIDNSSRGKHSWLTGLIKCGHCSRAMKVSFSAKAPQNKKFVCSGLTNYGSCVSSLRVSVQEIESVVEQEIFTHVQMQKELALHAVQQEDMVEKQHKMEIAKIDLQVENLIQALAEGSDTVVGYINEKIAALEERRVEIQRKQQLHNLSKASERQLNQFGDILVLWPNMTIDQMHDVAAMLIDTVKITDGSIQINWKYNFAS